jgi:hypothetical protein
LGWESEGLHSLPLHALLEPVIRVVGGSSQKGRARQVVYVLDGNVGGRRYVVVGVDRVANGTDDKTQKCKI